MIWPIVKGGTDRINPIIYISPHALFQDCGIQLVQADIDFIHEESELTNVDTGPDICGVVGDAIENYFNNRVTHLKFNTLI